MYSVFRRKPSHNNQEKPCIPTHDDKVSELRAAIGPISGRSLQYCTDSCLRRYLVARNWNVDKAKKMLEETLQWRSTFKPEEIRWDQVANVGENGLISRADFHDQSGRTVLIMRPAEQKTIPGEGNVRHLVYLVENAIFSLPEDQEQMTWLIDFTGWTMNTNVSIKVSREIIYVMQNHYPERVALIILYNAPRIFEAFWTVIKYFMEPKTVEKQKFVYEKNKDSQEIMKLVFDAENLPVEFGGNNKGSLKYDHVEFTKLMNQEDVKTAKFWGFDSKSPDKHLGVAPEPVSLVSYAT